VTPEMVDIGAEPTAGRWVKEPPTVPGRYWWRRYNPADPACDSENVPIIVYERCDTVRVAWCGEWYTIMLQEPPQ
jgi:hypothetical protein